MKVHLGQDVTKPPKNSAPLAGFNMNGRMCKSEMCVQHTRTHLINTQVYVSYRVSGEREEMTTLEESTIAVNVGYLFLLPQFGKSEPSIFVNPSRDW